MLSGRVRFGPFEVDVTSGELWRDGVSVGVQELPFRLLTALIERPGAVVTRAELSARLWGFDTHVDAAAGLNTAVAKLREALGDSADTPKYIETIPKRGYRFVGAIESPSATASENLVAAQRNAAAAGRIDDGRTESPSADRLDSGIGAKASAERLKSRQLLPWTIAAALIAVAVLVAAFQLRADRGRIRVAVVLFDNETGRPQLGRLAQGLTDATVAELTGDSRLAVIGNAAVLRTERPFRDIAKVRDAVGADYIVIGQVQTLDAGTIVRAHLIRARDESHVWVDAATLTDGGEAALQRDVSRRIRSAIDRTLGAQP